MSSRLLIVNFMDDIYNSSRKYRSNRIIFLRYYRHFSENAMRLWERKLYGEKKNILYISERIWRLGLFVLGMMTVMFAFAFFGAIRGKSPIWLAVFSGVAELAYSLTGWFWIIKPYRNSEKIIERFLEGYLISETDGEKAAMLTPYTAEQIKYTEKIFFTLQKLMDLNKRQAQYLAAACNQESIRISFIEYTGEYQRRSVDCRA